MKVHLPAVIPATTLAIYSLTPDSNEKQINKNKINCNLVQFFFT